jgi:hypothetical protein
MSTCTAVNIPEREGRIERIVLLDFTHHLVSQKTNKIEELKL